MSSRREFIQWGAVAGSLCAAAAALPSIGTPKGDRASKSLRILILGGTGFLGPHFVQAAIDRGHRVAVFNRGKDNAKLPPHVERLIGDRNGHLESIKARDWDAVLDLATYVPVWVRTLSAALQGRVKHYTFISTEMVYDTPGRNENGTDESARVLEYTGSEDPFSFAESPQYGEMKVICEREAQRQFASRTLVLRPGFIVGPGDSLGFFTYWPVRLKRGGEILTGGNARARVQWIDVRDLAAWTIRLVERDVTGVFNAIGPQQPLNWASMLERMQESVSAHAHLTWVAEVWLTQQKLPGWSNSLFWATEMGVPGLMNMRNEKAISQGLTFRPLEATTRDTLDWYESLPEERQNKVLLGIAGNSTLQESMAREAQLLAEWRVYAGTVQAGDAHAQAR